MTPSANSRQWPAAGYFRPTCGLTRGSTPQNLQPENGLDTFVSHNRPRAHQHQEHYMNKSELVAAVADYAQITQSQAAAAVNAVIESVTTELKNGGEVTLVGFGTFNVKERAARTGRNPQTGKSIEIAAAKIPSFRPGKSLKDAVN
ncbi:MULTISPECIES: HU family DNA-binding protein [Ectopseudomonas]|nr:MULTISPECIES: HU family DNA-binding protein [Pseudomonas]